MNKIMKKLLLAGNKLMPELHLIDSLKIKKEQKNLKKPEIQDIFIQMNQIKLAFNMIQLKKILNI